ncbi:hypothetical protein TrispH2_003686 [Trichoplax sp. H2]|nr:hypothetical protein TrispH2_003686 [Trichoplax sp. H2]|eukprot:RDD43694.1 hypothetical protein TrispH2_003686 [Trichoplax sp. H2]
MIGHHGHKVMSSVQSARKRLANMPKVLQACHNEAIIYGKCVSQKENLGHNNCLKEFNALAECARATYSVLYCLYAPFASYLMAICEKKQLSSTSTRYLK